MIAKNHIIDFHIFDHFEAYLNNFKDLIRGFFERLTITHFDLDCKVALGQAIFLGLKSFHEPVQLDSKSVSS